MEETNINIVSELHFKSETIELLVCLLPPEYKYTQVFFYFSKVDVYSCYMAFLKENDEMIFKLEQK